MTILEENWFVYTSLEMKSISTCKIYFRKQISKYILFNGIYMS